MTAEQVGTLSESRLRTYTLAQLRELKAGGFSLEQLAWSFITENATAAPLLEKLSADQIGKLSDEVVAHLTPEQLRANTRRILAALTKEQLAQIRPEIVSKLEQADFNCLNATDKLQALDSSRFSKTQLEIMITIAGAAQTLLQRLSPAQISALVPDVLGSLTTERLGTLSADQVATLTPDQIRRLTRAQIRSMAAAKFTGSQLAYRIADGTSLLSNLDDVSALSINALAQMSVRSMAELDKAKLLAIYNNGTGIDKFRALPGAGLIAANFVDDNRELVEALTLDQIAALQPKVLDAVFTKWYSLVFSDPKWRGLQEKITPYQIPELSNENLIALWGWTHFNSMSAANVGALKQEQFRAIKANGDIGNLNCSALTNTQLNFIYDDADSTHTLFSLLSNNQLQQLPVEAIRKLTPVQFQAKVAVFTADQKSKLTAVEMIAFGVSISHLAVEKIKDVPLAHLISLGDVDGRAVLGALSPARVAALTEAQINALSRKQLLSLNSAGFTAAQLGYHGSDTWPNTVFDLIREDNTKLPVLSLDTVRGLTAAQIRTLTGAQIKLFELPRSVGQLALTADQVSVLTEAQMQELNLFGLDAHGFMPWMVGYKDKQGQPMFSLAGVPEKHMKYDYWHLNADFVRAMDDTGQAFLLNWSSHTSDDYKLTAEQTQGIRASVVRAHLTQKAMQSMTSEALKGFDVSQLGGWILSLPTKDQWFHHWFNVLTPKQVAELSTTVIQRIPGDAWIGFDMGDFTPKQVSALTRNQFAAMTDDQVQNLNGAGLTVEQLTYATSQGHAVWRELTGDQLHALSAQAVASLSVTQLYGFTGADGRILRLNTGILTASKIIEFRTTYGRSLLSHLTLSQLNGYTSRFSADAVSGFDSTDFNTPLMLDRDSAMIPNVYRLDVSALKGKQLAITLSGTPLLNLLSENQLGDLPPAAVRGLSSSQLVGVYSRHLAYLNSLNGNCFSSTQLNFDISGQTLLQRLTNTQLSQLDPTEFAKLTAAQMAVLTADQFKQLPGDGLTIEHLQATLSTGQVAKTQLTATQIGNLRTAVLAQMAADHFRPRADGSRLDPRNLAPYQLAALSPEVIRALDASKLTTYQLDRQHRISHQGSIFDDLSEDQVAALQPNVLKYLPPSDFSDLSAAQVGSLQESQLLELSAAQIQQLDASGFTAQQMGFTKTSGVVTLGVVLSALSDEQLANLAPAAVAALSQQQIATISLKQIKLLRGDGLTALQLDYVTDSGRISVYDALSTDQKISLSQATLMGVSDDRLRGFVGHYLSLLSPAQLSALSATLVNEFIDKQWRLLSVDQLQALNVSDLPIDKLKWTYPSATANTPTLLKALSARQMATLGTSVISALNTNELGHLSAAQVAALTVGQLAVLDAGKIQAITDASGWTAEQLVYAISGGSQTVWAALAAGADNRWLSKLSDATVAALTQAHFSALTVEKVQKINAAGLVYAQFAHTISGGSQTVWAALVAGADHTWLSKLSNATVGALTQAHFTALTAAQVKYLNAAGLVYSQLDDPTNTADKTVWQALGDEQLDYLSADIVSRLSQTELRRLNVVQLQRLNGAGITGSQLSHQITQSDLIRKFSSARTVIEGLSGYQVSQLQDSVLIALSSDQLATLSAEQVQGLTAHQFGVLTAAKIGKLNTSALTIEQLRYTDSSGISTVMNDLVAEQWSTLHELTLKALSPLEFRDLPALAFSKMPADRLRQWSRSQIQQLGSAAVGGLDSAQLIGVDKYKNMILVDLSATQIAWVTPAQLAAIADTTLKTLRAAQVAALTTGANGQLAALSDAQVRAISAGGWRLDQLNSNTATSGKSVWQALNEDNDHEWLGKLSADVVGRLSNAQLQGLNQAQLRALNVAGLKKEQLVLVPTDIAPPTTILQNLLSNLNPDALGQLQKLSVQNWDKTTLGLQYTGSGVAGKLINQLTTEQLGDLLPATLQSLTQGEVDGTLLTAATIGRLPARSVGLLPTAAITTTLLNNLSANGITGLTAAQFYSLDAAKRNILASAAKAGGLTYAQLRYPIANNGNSIISAWVSDQKSATPPFPNPAATLSQATFSQLTQGDFVGLMKGALIQGITGSYFTREQLDYVDGDGHQVFNSLVAVQWQALTPKIIAQLSDAQFAQLMKLDASVNWSTYSADQIAAIRPWHVAHLTESAINQLTADKIHKLDLSALVAGQINWSIRSSDPSGTNGGGGTLLAALSVSELIELSPATLGSLTAEQLRTKFAPTGFVFKEKLNAAETALLQPYLDLLSKLSKDQLAAMHDDRIQGLAWQQASALNINALSSAQLQLVPTPASNAKPVWRLIVEREASSSYLEPWDIPQDILNGIPTTYTAAEKLPERLVQMLSAQSINKLQKSYGDLNAFARLFSVNAIQKINPQVFADLSLDFISSLSHDQAFSLLSSQIAHKTPGQLAALQKTPYALLSAAEIKNLPTASGSAFNSRIDQLGSDLLAAITPDQVRLWTPAQIPNLSLDQLKLIPLITLMQFTKPQYEAILPANRSALAEFHFPPATFASANHANIAAKTPGLWFTDASLAGKMPTISTPHAVLREYYSAMTAQRAMFSMQDNFGLKVSFGSYYMPKLKRDSGIYSRLDDEGRLIADIDDLKKGYNDMVSAKKTMLQGGRFLGSVFAIGTVVDTILNAHNRARNQYEENAYIVQGVSYALSALQVPYATIVATWYDHHYQSRINPSEFKSRWTLFKEKVGVKGYRDWKQFNAPVGGNPSARDRVRNLRMANPQDSLEPLLFWEGREMRAGGGSTPIRLIPTEELFTAATDRVADEVIFSQKISWSDANPNLSLSHLLGEKRGWNIKNLVFDGGIIFVLSDIFTIVNGFMQMQLAIDNEDNRLSPTDRGYAIASGIIGGISGVLLLIGDTIPILTVAPELEKLNADGTNIPLRTKNRMAFDNVSAKYPGNNPNEVRNSIRQKMIWERYKLKYEIDHADEFPGFRGRWEGYWVNHEDELGFPRLNPLDRPDVYPEYADIIVTAPEAEKEFAKAITRETNAIDAAASAGANRVASVFVGFGWLLQYTATGIMSVVQAIQVYSDNKSSGNLASLITHTTEAVVGTFALALSLAIGGPFSTAVLMGLTMLAPDGNQIGRVIDLGARQDELQSKSYQCTVWADIILDRLIKISGVQIIPLVAFIMEGIGWTYRYQPFGEMKENHNFKKALKEGAFMLLRDNNYAIRNKIKDSMQQFGASYHATLQIRLGLDAHTRDFFVTNYMDDVAYKYWSVSRIIKDGNFSLDDVDVGFYSNTVDVENFNPSITHQNLKTVEVKPMLVNLKKGSRVFVDIDGDAVEGSTPIIDLSHQFDDLEILVKVKNLTIMDGSGANQYLLRHDLVDTITLSGTDGYDIVKLISDTGLPITLNLDRFGGAVVSAGYVQNTITGSLAHQNYCFEFGAEEDTVTLAGGFGSATVAGGAQVTMSGGNNNVSLVLGLTRQEGEETQRRETILNGGEAAESYWPPEGEFVTGRNDLTFVGSACGIEMTIKSQEKESDFKTKGYASTDIRYDSGKFKYFHKIAGSHYGDTITVQDTTTLHLLELGIGNNAVSLNNAQGVEIKTRAMGVNIFRLENDSEAVIETKGGATSYTEVLSNSTILATLGGMGDTLNLRTGNTIHAGVVITKEGTHTIDIDQSGIDVHVFAKSNTTTINHTYSTTDGTVKFGLGASLFDQLIRRTTTGIQVVSWDDSNQELNYNLKDLPAQFNDVKTISATANIDALGLNNVFLTGRPSLLSQTQWTADLEAMIQAMARLDTATAAQTSYNGETNYYQMTQVFSNIHAQMTLANP
jgi:hypothetical protein